MAEWDAAYINDLPDSAFAVILPGGEKDAEGRTVPRDLRKLPHHNAAGELDMPHLRNALSREPQSDMSEGMHGTAHAHLMAHAEAEGVGEERSAEAITDSDEMISTEIPDSEIEVRSIERREIGAYIAKWDTPSNTQLGLESIRRGAFAHIDPRDIVLKTEHNGPVVGRGSALEERGDGAHMTFLVSRTANGDEALTLANDRVLKHVSIEYSPTGTLGEVAYTRGKRTVQLTKVDLRAVASTYKPAYSGADITYVREEQGVATMAETQEALVAGAVLPPTPVPEPVDLSPITASITALQSSVGDRLDKLEEQRRSEFTIPGGMSDPKPRTLRGDWMSTVLRMLSGERVNDLQTRALEDLITSDNVGVVPDAFLTELIGVIDPARPFLQSTRKLDLPNAGMSLVVPKIVTRPTAGVQARYGDESFPEKSEITSTATSITNVTFDAVTIAGGGDISLQLLKRSSPSYLSLFLELLAEAYGQNAEAEALDSLIATVGNQDGVNDGGTLSPSDLELGPAWGFGAAVKKPITTMWLSSAAVGAFIDAKASGTNAPLYSNIQAGFTAGAGPAGTISGLRPVYVPSLDATAIDVLVGPSSGFGWTEDGTYSLQVDVPAKAGRDVAIVGILWFAPMYPTAFTAYAIGS